MGDWPSDGDTDLSPVAYLQQIGSIFVTFEARPRHSGNVSFGVEANGRRWFVKSAGDPADTSPFLSHQERVALLLNARRLALEVAHPALPTLHGLINSAWGPLLVYDWLPGELVGVPSERRDDPDSAFQRFRRLPLDKLVVAIDTILDVHMRLCGAGWIACDLYDGSIMYNFVGHRTRVIDLDSYHKGPFVNEMGRMFGSTRFMAPEEFERGAPIDERTTVFTLGRMISVFLGDGDLSLERFGGGETQYRTMLTACSPDPVARFQSVAELVCAWRGKLATT